jgi:hypothetical protein
MLAGFGLQFVNTLHYRPFSGSGQARHWRARVRILQTSLQEDPLTQVERGVPSELSPEKWWRGGLLP